MTETNVKYVRCDNCGLETSYADYIWKYPKELEENTHYAVKRRFQEDFKYVNSLINGSFQIISESKTRYSFEENFYKFGYLKGKQKLILCRNCVDLIEKAISKLFNETEFKIREMDPNIRGD